MKISINQAVKLAKKQFIKDHGKRAYNSDISILPRYGGGHYILIIASGLSSEFYF